MPSGSCLCSCVKISYEGDPGFTSICHCLDCRKVSGSLFGAVFALPISSVKITSATTSTLQTFTKVSDGGKKITSHFCGVCGTTLFRISDSFPGMLGLRVGVLDDGDSEHDVDDHDHVSKKGRVDAVDEMKVQMELFVERRPAWLKAVEGAEQRDGQFQLIK